MDDRGASQEGSSPSAVRGSEPAPSEYIVPTWGVILDVLFGLLLPAFCLLADPTGLLESYLGEYGGLGMGFLFFEMVVFVTWLAARRRLTRGHAVFGVLLILGGAAALFLGLVLLPLTLIGLIAIIGVLGLVPFGTAFVFFRAGLRAFRAGGVSPTYAKVLVGIPALATPVFAAVSYEAVHERPDLERVARSGEPYVRAIYAYRNDHGLWPQYAKDLVPDYLPELPPDEWEYDEAYSIGKWVRWKETPFDGHVLVRYAFHSEAEGWAAVARESFQELEVGGTEKPRSETEVKVPLDVKVKELRRRIAREPEELDHFKELISLEVEEGTLARASAAAIQARDAHPDEWWPGFVLADIERRASAGTAFEEAFDSWVNEHPRFTHLWYLTQHVRAKGERERGIELIRRTLTYPFVSFDNDSYTMSHFFFSLAAHAYQAGAYDLAIEICDREDQEEWSEGSHLAIRAASLLRLGRSAEAVREAKAALEEDERRPMWAGNLEELLAAAERGDGEYEYPIQKKRAIELYRTPR